MNTRHQGHADPFSDKFEETLIAVFLGLMTLITFANVVARYAFNDNLLWALEATVFLFAWMVLIGVSYGVKKSFHLGVDLLIDILTPQWRRRIGLLAVAACLAFSLLLLKGGWDYWYPFVTKQAFLETNDIPMPEFMQFLATWLNEGEYYEKLPRFIPYAVMPLSMALLSFRFFQAGWYMLTGKIDRVIAAHEAEEALDGVTKPVVEG